MTPTIEPYRMIEPLTFTDEELAAVQPRNYAPPSVPQVLWFAARYLFWMLVTYIVICELSLLGR